MYPDLPSRCFLFLKMSFVALFAMTEKYRKAWCEAKVTFACEHIYCRRKCGSTLEETLLYLSRKKELKHILQKIHTEFHLKYLKWWMVMMNLGSMLMERSYLCSVCKYNEGLSPNALLKGCKCPSISHFKHILGPTSRNCLNYRSL